MLGAQTATARRAPPRGGEQPGSWDLHGAAGYAEKDVPQPQVDLALGFSNLKPAPCTVVT
ncbi:MAG: hypothetical protein RL653_769 [Pseudomonadota bacterium]